MIQKTTAKVISVSLQKGGCGKSNLCVNLGIGLARNGKKVLIIDADSQGSLTTSLGWRELEKLKFTLATAIGMIIKEMPIAPKEGVLTHSEEVDIMPANVELSGVEIMLVNTMSRETILRQYIDTVRAEYDYILIDNSPSLGMLTINALAAADSVIIPVQAQYLSVKGLELLLQSVKKIQRNINPNLSIMGILLTMVDTRTNYTKDTISLLNESYGSHLNIFQTRIPFSVRLAEISSIGKSIYAHNPHGKAAQAYENLTKEVIFLEQ
jgi:chromosome partitioning protein